MSHIVVAVVDIVVDMIIAADESFQDRGSIFTYLVIKI